MIFATVGSTDFDALVAAMDKLAPQLGEEVVLQVGLGQYVPQHAQHFRFAPSLEPYYQRASVVVAHGGLGTITEVLELGVRLVCVVNPTTYDRHQEHLLQVFAGQDLLQWCRDLSRLGEAIGEAKAKVFARYRPPECQIHDVIRRYLAGLPWNVSSPGRSASSTMNGRGR